MKCTIRIIKDDIANSHRTLLVDIEICESVQKGVKSRSFNKGFSVERENGVYHFQTLFKQELIIAFGTWKSKL